jgi:hypothetical protein
MPTTIPIRVSTSESDDGVGSFCRAMLGFYVVLALVLMSITGIETHFGMYPRLTFSQAFFTTFGTDAGASATGSSRTIPPDYGAPFDPG